VFVVWGLGFGFEVWGLSFGARGSGMSISYDDIDDDDD
jgi:hypothetical protein